MLLSMKISFLIQFCICCQVLVSVVSMLWHYMLLLFALLKRLSSGQDMKFWQGFLI